MTKARDLASAAPAPSTVSATELGYLDGVSSAIQTQIDGKSATAHNHNSDYIAKTLTTTTGDMIYASSANNPARLGIGSTGQVLSVSGGVPAWSAAPSSSLTMSSIASGSLSGALQLQFTSLSTYDEIWVFVDNLFCTNNVSLNFTLNNNGTTNIYQTRRFYHANSTGGITPYKFNSSNIRVNDQIQANTTDSLFWLHFWNCKNSGLTMFDLNFTYYKNNSAPTGNTYIAEWGSGYFNSSATISTLEINANNYLNGGTYNVIAG